MNDEEEKIAIQALISKHTPKELATLWSRAHRNGALYSLVVGVFGLIAAWMFTLSIMRWIDAGGRPDPLGREALYAMVEATAVFTSVVLIAFRISTMKLERRRIDKAIVLQREQQYAAMQMH